MQTDTATDVVPYEGLAYTPREIVPDTAEERRLLGIVGTPEDTFGGGIDPAAFITLAIEEGVRNGVSAHGGVNMLQTLVVTRLPRMGEPLALEGGVTSVTEAPRGRVTTSETRYSGTDGAHRLTSARTSLKTDPTRYADPTLRGAGDRPAPIIADPATLKLLGTVTLTPEITTAYSLSTLNPVHTDPDAAWRAGYRAPIIGGAHGVRYLTRAIWEAFAPRTVRLDIRFRRPIFWDDSFEVRVADGRAAWDAICLARDGKVLVEMKIADLTAD